VSYIVHNIDHKVNKALSLNSTDLLEIYPNKRTFFLKFSYDEVEISMRGESSMSSQLPEKKHKKDKEPFGEIMKSMNHFLNERPVKGFLESIDEFFKNPFPSFSFPIDVAETAGEYIITAELPGIKREQIHIDTLGNQLTIKINNSEEIHENDEINQIYRRRKNIQSSSRTINFPTPINEKQVKATYRDGLLQIKIPRTTGKSIQID
jgi:HSP20 family protein